MTFETAQIEAQKARENTMVALGKARELKKQARATERGEVAETPAGVNLAKRAVQPMVNAIEAFIASSKQGRGLRRGTAAVALEKLDPNVAAYITVRMLLTTATRRNSLKSAALGIASRLEHERIADALEKHSEPLYRAVMRNSAQRGFNGTLTARSVKQTVVKGNIPFDLWTVAEKLHIGTKLVELAIESLGIFRGVYMAKDRNKTTHIVELDPSISKWFKEYNDAAALAHPVYLPMVAPPQPWDGVEGGSYYSPVVGHNPLISRAFPGQLKALAKADLSVVYKGLNGIQATPWRINRRVLEVMEHMWNQDEGLPCLPKRREMEVPTPPAEVEAAEKGSAIRKEWRSKMAAIHSQNALIRAQAFEFSRLLAVAKDCMEEPEIFFPHRLDFRGRAYAASTSLSPQGADEAKGLLEFAEGKPLGERGLYWLGVHGANLFGYDKVSLDDRYSWACRYCDVATRIANDPLGNLDWTEADKPWCFLAWCFEWAGMYQEAGLHGGGEHYISHMPIALDGSCNGIQHFSAMLRDPVGGAAVNLVPSDKPNDIYQKVADKTVELLQEAAQIEGENQWVAEGWLAFGLDRKITKRAVMVLPYGGTFKSCMDYVREAVREKIKGGKEHGFGDNLPKAEAYLASKVWEAISHVVIAARAAMGWLQECAKVANAAKKGITWTTPSGFKATQQYREMKDDRIKTHFMGSIIKFSSVEAADKLDRAKQVSAISPNFVHSLDASAMMITVGECLDKGITSFAMIHDSYGTHAADTDTLASTLRDSFVTMYQQNNVLQQFRDELAAQLPEALRDTLPPVPEFGSLDLEDVRKSLYFFS